MGDGSIDVRNDIALLAGMPSRLHVRLKWDQWARLCTQFDAAAARYLNPASMSDDRGVRTANDTLIQLGRTICSHSAGVWQNVVARGYGAIERSRLPKLSMHHGWSRVADEIMTITTHTLTYSPGLTVGR